MRVGIYVWVSTADQNQELQLRELQDYAARHGWQAQEINSDTINGASTSRPALNRLMDDARVRSWKLDRFGRSLRDCLNNLHELDSDGVRFIASEQGLDLDGGSPASRLMLHVLGADCARATKPASSAMSRSLVSRNKPILRVKAAESHAPFSGP